MGIHSRLEYKNCQLTRKLANGRGKLPGGTVKSTGLEVAGIEKGRSHFLLTDKN